LGTFTHSLAIVKVRYEMPKIPLKNALYSVLPKNRAILTEIGGSFQLSVFQCFVFLLFSLFTLHSLLSRPRINTN
ncbi:MAG: hypothetical protein WCZ21_06350, partial [Bacteroidales bacterium]